jgi:hypothetical protein
MEISLGAAAFWLALAAVMIASGWFKLRREAQKQQTLLHLIEKTGQLDEQHVKTLFPPPPPLPPHWFKPPERPSGRAVLRVFGTIVLSIATGLAILFNILHRLGTPVQQEDAVVGFAVASLVACFGVGLFVASRFVRPLPSERGDRGAP